MDLQVRERTLLDFSYVDLYNRVMADNDYDHNNIGNIVTQNIQYYIRKELERSQCTNCAIIDVNSFGRMMIHNVSCDFEYLAEEVIYIMYRLYDRYEQGELVLNEKLDKPYVYY